MLRGNRKKQRSPRRRRVVGALDARGDESGHEGGRGGDGGDGGDGGSGGGGGVGDDAERACRREVERVSSIPRKLYVFLADRMAGTSPEYIMCFPPLGLGY